MAQISGMERPQKRATKIAAITVSTSAAKGVSAATSRTLAERILDNRFRAKASHPMVKGAALSPHLLAAPTPPNRSTSLASSASPSLNPSLGGLPILQASSDQERCPCPFAGGSQRTRSAGSVDAFQTTGPLGQNVVAVFLTGN
jgi:hypothetical protein